MQALKTHCQMKHISLVWFVFSSLAISAFTTEMQTSPCLGREMKPPAHAGGTAASPGSQNPTPKNRNFRAQFWKPGHPCKCLSILQDFIPLLFCSGISSQLLCVFWDFFGLSDKNNNNKPNEPSKERAWTFSWRRQSGYSWILPASCLLSQKWTLLHFAPQRHTTFAYDVQLTTSTCQADSTSLWRMQHLSWRWNGREVQQCLAKTYCRVFSLPEKL